MYTRNFLAFLASLPFVFADAKFTAPEAGSTVQADLPFTITWTDGGNLPSLIDASSYTLVLYSGSNSKPYPITTLVASGEPSSKSAKVTISAELGGTSTNAYFLGMTIIAGAGRTINYSNRFTISNMTGSFAEDVQNGLSSVSGNSGPSNILMDGADTPELEMRDAIGPNAPYDEQTGPIRYAPMQPVPPTSITAQNTSPQYPTSSVFIATTILPIATVQTTITATQTFVVASKANTAAAQPQPSDDMAKFLNRWKD